MQIGLTVCQIQNLFWETAKPILCQEQLQVYDIQLNDIQHNDI
jgi:hypothetical protein